MSRRHPDRFHPFFLRVRAWCSARSLGEETLWIRTILSKMNTKWQLSIGREQAGIKVTRRQDKEGLVSSAFLIQWTLVLCFFSIFSCFLFLLHPRKCFAVKSVSRVSLWNAKIQKFGFWMLHSIPGCCISGWNRREDAISLVKELGKSDEEDEFEHLGIMSEEALLS